MNKYEVLWNRLRQNIVRNIENQKKAGDTYSNDYKCNEMVLIAMGKLESDFFELQMKNGGISDAD